VTAREPRSLTAPGKPLAPFRHPAFRAIWIANLASNLGSMIQSVGAAWLMTELTPSHQLIALVQARLAFVSYGVPEAGDAHWLDHRGSLMAAVAAGRVWRLLGRRDLGLGDDWNAVRLPTVGQGLLAGALAWRQHDGGHTDGPNWKYFIPWADRLLKHAPMAR